MRVVLMLNMLESVHIRSCLKNWSQNEYVLYLWSRWGIELMSYGGGRLFWDWYRYRNKTRLYKFELNLDERIYYLMKLLCYILDIDLGVLLSYLLSRDVSGGVFTHSVVA